MSETFTAYVTKYALTSGIQVIQARRGSGDDSIIKDKCSFMTMFFGKDWHRTPEAAIARAEEMRLAKIASVEKQIAKLRKLKFEVPA